MASIVVSKDDSLPDVLRRLLALADHPRDVRYEPGTRTVHVPEELADRFVEASASTPDDTPAAEVVQRDPAESPAPDAATPAKPRRPARKAAAPKTEE